MKKHMTKALKVISQSSKNVFNSDSVIGLSA